MNHSRTRSLTEGALLVAFFAVLLLISIYVPILWIVSSMFLVLPFIVYSAKYSFKSSLLMIVASIGVSAIIGTLLSLPLAIAYGTTGVVMGWMIKEKKSKFNIFVASTLIFMVNAIVQYVISVLFFEINFIEETFSAMNNSMLEIFRIAKSSGWDVSRFESTWSTNVIVMESLIPTLLVFSVALLVWGMIAINFPIVKRLKIDVPIFQPFRELSLPKSVIWYYLITILLTLFSSPEPGSMFALAMVNLQMGLELLMILQGISFIHFYGHLKKWSKSRLVFIMMFAIVLTPFTRILGIIDLGFDLRQRLQQNKK